MTAFGVRREKAALSSGCKAHPAIRSSRKQSEQSWRWNHPQSVSGARQLHGYAVAPVVALQAQGLATQGRSLSTPAPLRALRPRTPDPAWSWPVVGEGVTSCPRAGCGNPPVRFDERDVETEP